MARRTMALVALIVGALTTGAAAEFKPLKLDPVHSRIGFTASTVLFDVQGQFKRYTVQIDGDPNQPAQAKVRANIDAASLDTQNGTRDKHLSSDEFFDVKRYPKITFVSERIVQDGPTWKVTGPLEIHGVKKQVTIPFTVAKGKNGEGVDTTSFKGTLKLNRHDFGVGSASVAAKISLQDEVNVELLLVAFL